MSSGTRRSALFTARRVAVLLVLVLVAYLGLVGWRGVLLIADGSLIGVLLGLGVIVLPIIGAWVIWREVAFGLAMQDMGRELDTTGALPVDDLPRRPSGRPERAAADERFAERRLQVEAAPDDWRAWFRLSLAYDDAGDRKRAREAMRHAIALRGAP